MLQSTFDEQVKQRLDNTLNILTVKAKEYSRNNNPLHNFESGNQITNKHPTEVLDGFMLKHYISYRDMLKDISDGKQISYESVLEKFGDLIVYFVIQEIQFKQYAESFYKEKIN